jgi:hypothetical protein
MKLFQLLVAVCLAGVVGATTVSAAPRTSTDCLTKGSIVGYLKSVSRQPCSGSLAVGASLHKAIIITTNGDGQLEYKALNVFDRCITKHNSQDKYFPSSSVAVKHVYGVTWCRVKATDSGKTYTAAGVIVQITGTIFGLHSDKTGSTVKVAEGVVLVSSTTRKGKAVRVPAGFQVFVPLGGLPGKPVRLKADTADKEAITALTLDSRTLEADGLRGLFRVEKRHSAGIVAPDTATLDAIRARLAGFPTTGMTRDEFDAAPATATGTFRDADVDTVIISAATQLGATTVIRRVRTDLGPDIAVLFVPASTT